MRGTPALHILLLLLLSTVAFPQEKESDILFESAGYDFPYQLNRPDKTWKMPRNLVEISGLSYVDPHHIACIQDEKATIYFFNTQKGVVDQKTDFGHHGDYEGIELVNGDVWILKSNGTLYRVRRDEKNKPAEAVKFNTLLSEKNNAEGLGYDASRKCLLIACKGYPFLKDEQQKEAGNYKAVYRFYPASGYLDFHPDLLINLDSIKQYKHYSTMTLWGIKLFSWIHPSEGDVSFMPSAIAVHPVNGNLYLLASAGKLLAVFTKNGKLLALVKLQTKIHLQPEGLCFAPDGTLFIANEGKDVKGKIFKFNAIRR